MPIYLLLRVLFAYVVSKEYYEMHFRNEAHFPQ